MSGELNFKQIDTVGSWSAPQIMDYDAIPKGDMPGDKISINEKHVKKAQMIFPHLLAQLVPLINNQANHRAVISVHGGSGVGKSEIGSLLAFYLNTMGIGSYILSGDNYPHRIPRTNDAERMRVFREAGIKGLVAHHEFTKDRNQKIQDLQDQDQDANSELCSEWPWLAIYQEAGRIALANYLGTSLEIDFAEVSGLLTAFKNGASKLLLKRMGRDDKDLWYDAVDLSKIQVLVIEWTHGNNDNLIGVDIPILLNSTPQETLEHRRSRNRDGGVDRPFTTMVLAIEQALLHAQAKKAKIIVTKSGAIVTYADYLKSMA
ncbi:MAG: adenylylsulfate kinase [Eubacteriales bacterium]|nr:adenylylsulfate kinase [Eubacteriales bacterium]